MILAVAACLIGLAAPESIVMPVPGSPVQVQITLEGFKKGPSTREDILLYGAMPPALTQVSIIALIDPVDHLGTEWRDIREREHEQTASRLNMKAGPFQKFEMDGTACDERSVEIEDTAQPAKVKMADYRAYLMAARYCFEVHVSWTNTGDGSAFTRDDLQKIVRAIKVGVYRKGSFGDYPPAVVDFVDQAARHMPGELEWLAAEAAKRPNDYVPHFVLGEISHVVKDPSKGLKGYERATALLKKLSKPTPKETWVRMRAEHGFGLALTFAHRVPEALPHYLEAHKIAVETKHADQAGLAYVLAMAYAGGGDSASTAKYLKEAITLDPKFREEAKNNEFIRKVATSKPIKDLLEPAAENKKME